MMNNIKQLFCCLTLITALAYPAHAQVTPDGPQAGSQTTAHKGLTQYPKLSTTCQIFAVNYNLFSTQIKIYSTHDLSQCTTTEFAPFTSTSVQAQLETVVPGASFSLGGPYYQMADLDMSKVGTHFIDVGMLRFALSAVGKFDWLDALKQPALLKTWWSKQMRYIPFQTRQELELIWFKGSEIYELVSPTGEVYQMAWVTQAFMSRRGQINPSTLSDYLNLPVGWSFRIRTLSANNIIFVNQEAGFTNARIVDQLGNIYIQRIGE